MTTTSGYLESPFNLWQEWASEHRASCRAFHLPDLLSEYVDPVQERHMTLPCKRMHRSKWSHDHEWSLNLMAYMESKSRSRRPFGASTSSTSVDSKHQLSNTAPRSKDSPELSTIDSFKTARPRLPFRCNNCATIPKSAKTNSKSALIAPPRASTPPGQPEPLHDEANNMLARKISGHSSFSVATARTHETSDTISSFASANSTTIPDVSGMHIPPELHASYSFIHEQQVIWNEIMSKAKAKSNVPIVVEWGHSDDREPASVGIADWIRREDEGSHDENENDIPGSLEGRQVELHGSLVNILGRDRVYDALANGTTKIITCIGCESNLLATLSTKLLFCPDCGTLTPINLTKSQPQIDFQQESCQSGDVM